LASLSGIGALDGARIAFYYQEKRVYDEVEFTGHFEILSLIGNVSIRDGKPMCHAHIILGDETGSTFGGHLVKGCTIFACELVIFLLQGEPLERGLDQETGLPLWGGDL
jgi:predicted DNA-binding protein with PD1-like motif